MSEDRAEGSGEQAKAAGTPNVANALGQSTGPASTDNPKGGFDASSGGALERATGRVAGQEAQPKK